MYLEIADSGIVGVQLVPMGGGKLFLWLLKPDGGIFRMNRLVGFKVGDMGKHGVDLFHALFLRLHLCPDRNGLPADGIQIGVQTLHGGQLFFPQIADSVHDLVEVVHSAFELAFARPAGALLPAQIQIFAQQLRQGGFLRFLQGFQQDGLFLFQVCNPAFQVAHHLTDRLHEPVGGGNVPVQVADIGLYSSFLHLADRWPHVDGGDFIKPLPLIGTKVKAFRAVIGFQIAIGDSRPALPPYLGVLLVVPVYGVLLVAFPVPGWEPDTLAILVKVINLPALGKPFSGFVHCPHGQQNVGVGIPVPLVVNGKIGNHAFGNKKLPAIVPDQVGVL